MASVEFALGGYMRARLETWEGDTNIANNTSVVYARIKVWRTNSWSGQTYSSSVRREIWIDGSCVCDWTGEISHYASYGEIEVASGNRTITHNSDGTKSVGVQAYLTDNVSSYFSGSGSLSMTLGTIPRGSSGTFSKSTYTIGEEIKINFDRKSNSFTHAGYIQYPDRDGWVWAGEKYFSGAGSSWSWTPTQAEKKMLYGRVPNAQSAKMWADCKTMNGGTEISQFSVGQAIMKVNPDECRPLFSNFTFADTNSATTAITGNNQVMISGKSTLAVTISAANKATARLSATMKKYTFQAAGLTAEETYTTSAITKTLGSPTVDASETPSATRDLVVTALDSRSISTPVTKQITIVPYSSPKISATATRLNGFENTTTVKISGTFSRIEVGGTAKNTVNSSTGVKYRYRQQGTSTWGSWTNKAATIDTATGKVTVANFVLNLDNQQAFEFEFRITDKLETTTVSLTVSVGQPAFYIGTDGRVGVGGMPTLSKQSNEQGLLEVAGRAFANGHRLLEDDTATVSGSNIDWATAGGQWVESGGMQTVNSGNAWTDVNVSNWDKTVSVVNGATYAIFMFCPFVNNSSGNSTELDIHTRIASGGTAISNGNSTMVQCHGAARSTITIVKATSTSLRIQNKLMCGTSNQTIRIDEGGYLIIRIG